MDGEMVSGSRVIQGGRARTELPIQREHVGWVVPTLTLLINLSLNN
jgi:hypothetical protein